MKISYRDAINQALAEEMRRDDKVIVFGEDVAEYEGSFKVTRGLLKEFGPTRVFDTPISEAAIVGSAIGAALGGLRPVPELIAAPVVSFLPVRQVPLARLEAPFADDFEAMAESPTDAPCDRLWRDFQIVENTGGAYILSFRSDLLGSAEHAAALGGLLRAIKQRGAWMATGGDMAEWWIRRQRVLTDVRQVNDRRIRLAVSNSGSHPISDASVYVYLPRVPSRLRVTALLGSGIPHYQVSQDGVLRLDFSKLAARASYLCLISMDEK